VVLRAAWKYFRQTYDRYRKVPRVERGAILDEFCRVIGYSRKYAIRVLNGPRPEGRPPKSKRRPRGPAYSERTIEVLSAIWEASGYPWSVRLNALLPIWLPWAKRRFRISAETEGQLQRISTKPGTLLKHHIPIKTDHWDVKGPGYTEIDLVSHSGNTASGEFLHSLNVTDIHTAWVETRAVMGKGQARVLAALEQIRAALPFPLKAIDSDNGSEFINAHLFGYCRQESIQFTRGRPYKKDDNAHIEQKNWTHVRKLLGWDRYDSDSVLAALNELYRGDLRLLQNLFLPSVKLVEKKRVGSRLRRRYDQPRTPLDRVASCADADAELVAQLIALRERLDPFAIAASVEAQLDNIYGLANHRRSPASSGAMEAAAPDAPDGKAVDAQTDARPQAFPQALGRPLRGLPQGLGKRSALPTAPTARATTQTTTTTDNVTKAPPTPSRAKPMDGPSKPSKKRPPTGFRRRSRRHAKRAPKAARVTSQMARR